MKSNKTRPRHETLKEKYMVSGNVVETQQGHRYLIVNDKVMQDNYGSYLDIYDDEMIATHNDGSQTIITKVYEYKAIYWSGIKNDYFLTLIWERPKEIKLTDFEKEFLNKLDDTWKWIARDFNCSLWLYEKEPTLDDEEYRHRDYTHFTLLATDLFDSTVQFKDITFESGAHLISELIK